MSVRGNESSYTRAPLRVKSRALCLISALVMVAFVATLKGAEAKADAPPSPEQIGSLIEDQWSKIRNLHLKWHVEYRIHPAWANNDDFQFAALLNMEEFAVLDSMIYNCQRLWKTDAKGKPLTTWEDNKNAFDGTNTICLQTDATFPKVMKNSIVSIQSGLDEYALFVHKLYLESAGGLFYDGKHFDWNSTCDGLYARSMWKASKNEAAPQYDSSNTKPNEKPYFRIYDALKTGTYREMKDLQEVDGKSCVVLERAGRDKIWLDPSRNYALVKREWRCGAPGRGLVFVYHNTQFRDVSPGFWLPSKTRRDAFERPTADGLTKAEPILTVECKLVESFVGNVSRAVFHPDPAPGTPVQDLSRAKDEATGQPYVLSYVAGKDQQSTQEAMEQALAHRESTLSTPRSGNLSLLVKINIALVMAFAFVLILRRRLWKPSSSA